MKRYNVLASDLASAASDGSQATRAVGTACGSCRRSGDKSRKHEEGGCEHGLHRDRLWWGVRY
jgi:hypothetical protein